MELHLEEAEGEPALRGSGPPALSIVIPTYNEAGNVEPLVDRIDEALAGIRWEAIFVDDNSPDGTARRIREAGRRDSRVRCIRRFGRRGRASACLEGMMAAQAPVVAVMDADLQHDEAALPEMLRLVATGEADLVVGTRYIEGGSANGLHGFRRKISRWAGGFARALLAIELSDPTSGYFATRRDVADLIAAAPVADGFNTTLDIATSRKLDLKIAEVAYDFRPRGHGDSKFRVRQALEFLALIGSRLTASIVPPRFILFCGVGFVGLFVHMAVLGGALGAGAHFAVGQSVATLTAITNNFLLNNATTFRDRHLSGWNMLRGLLVYIVICSFGAVTNVGVASWLFAMDTTWWLAGFAGAVISAIWNYAASSAVIWR